MAKKKEQNELQQKLADVENQLKRALADYQNLEKRVSEGRSELTNWQSTELIKKLLTVLDHYEKALDGASDKDKQSGWFKGVELATGQLRQTLKDEGLEEIEIDPGSSFDKTQDKSPGTRFDPSLHEAVEVKEVPPSPEGSGESMEDKIVEVVRKGYTLNGKVLRPAQVVVGKSKVDGMSEEQEEKTVDTGDYA